LQLSKTLIKQKIKYMFISKPNVLLTKKSRAKGKGRQGNKQRNQSGASRAS
jgi:hypothetical protein